MSDELAPPAVGELHARHESFNEITEVRESLDGPCCIMATEDGSYLIKASDLSPAGSVKGTRIWK